MASVQPRGGYTSGAKRQYRRDVWAFIDRCLAGRVGVKDRKVLILESTLGREVEELLRRGYASGNIYVVNESPAVVATVQRQFAGDPRMSGPLRTCGSDVASAVSKYLAEGVKFDAINLDLTSCLNTNTLRTISLSAASMRDGGAFVVAFQRGRERGDIGSALMSPGDGDPHRPDALRAFLACYAISTGNEPACQNGCQWHFGQSKWEVYRGANSRVSMMWVGVQLIAHDSRHGMFWRTTDMFGPRCCIDLLSRKGIKASENLFVEYRNEDGQGKRLVLTRDALLTRIAALPPSTLANLQMCEFKRPNKLDLWKERRSGG